jgi:hypothetical protein
MGEEETQVSAPAAEVHYDDALPAAGQLYHRYGQALQLLALAFQPETIYIKHELIRPALPQARPGPAAAGTCVPA